MRRAFVSFFFLRNNSWWKICVRLDTVVFFAYRLPSPVDRSAAHALCHGCLHDTLFLCRCPIFQYNDFFFCETSSILKYPKHPLVPYDIVYRFTPFSLFRLRLRRNYFLFFSLLRFSSVSIRQGISLFVHSFKACSQQFCQPGWYLCAKFYRVFQYAAQLSNNVPCHN